MLKAVFEDTRIDIFHRMETETTVIPSGTFVMKDPADAEKVVVSDGTKVWGVLSQNVFPLPLQRTFQPFNDFEAYSGDPVGIYHEGYYETDQFVGDTFVPGQVLYVTNEGKLTGQQSEEPTAVAGKVPVGRFIKMKGSVMFFRLDVRPN